MAMKKKRQDTKLESEGAEFLVLGHLLVEGIACYKAYVNYPGFDLTAIDHTTNKSARIQVKSRWAIDSWGMFMIKHFDCDFVVYVALNRGMRYNKAKQSTSKTIKEVEFYIFPVAVVKAAQRDADKKMPFVRIKSIPNYEDYKSNWRLVSKFLGVTRQRLRMRLEDEE